MDSGIAVVVGALIGMAGTSSTAYATGVFGRRQMRTQLAAARAEWLLDNRRRAYHEFLTAARMFENAWWTLGNELDTGGDGRTSFGRIIELYPVLTAAEAGVQVLGPDTVADAARKLVLHLQNVDTLGTGWHQAAGEQPAQESRGQFWAAFQQGGASVEAVWRAAREVLTEGWDG